MVGYVWQIHMKSSFYFSGHVFGKETYHPSGTQILNGIELFYGW